MADALNTTHNIAGYVTFEIGEGGFTKAVLSNPYAGSKLEVYPYGAHISSWTTEHGEQIFMSKKALFGQGKAIRGGIPIIFPQFGPGKIQNHGFARNTTWEVVGTRVNKSEPVTVTIDLQLKESKFSLEYIWNHPFETTLSIHLSNKLAIEWKVKNTGKEAFEFQSALHTYLTVSVPFEDKKVCTSVEHLKDIKNASVVGLKGVTYIDKTKNAEKSTEDRVGVEVGEEVDRVYLDVKQNPILLVDKLLTTLQARDYTLRFYREGLSDVVVWNPWVEKAKGMADLGEENHPKFICVEVGEIGTPVKLAAGEQWLGKHSIETSKQTTL